jgi:hypothetical protein
LLVFLLRLLEVTRGVTKEIRGQVKRREERWEEGRRKGRGEEKDTPSAHMGFLYVGGFL